MSENIKSYDRKKLLAYLRNGDYAHAGEAEAIIQVMNRFPKNKQQHILDAGCGLGGTAYFIEENGGGKVTGIDIESDSISYAKQKYPSVEFHVTDVLNLSSLFHNKKFDLICLFNSFYAFKDQPSALLSLASVANEKASLAIFDYSDPLTEMKSPLYTEGSETMTPFKPIKVQDVPSMLSTTGWHLLEMKDISNDYLRWYADLLNRLTSNKETLITTFGQAAFASALKIYSDIYAAIKHQTLGGIIIYAERRD